jgi:hypothetical protein
MQAMKSDYTDTVREPNRHDHRAAKGHLRQDVPHADRVLRPLERGEETGLVEISGNWYIDDLPPMMFIKNAPNSHGWVNPRDVEDI